jgi:surfeit locus 1 family protein
MKTKIFTAFCLSWAIFFAYLGAWQVERMHWKEQLIAQTEKHKDENPEEFKIDEYDTKRDLFKKIFLNGKFLHENEILLSAKYFSSERDKNELGYHVITPFITTEGVIVFINRGWVPEAYKTRESRPDSLYEGNIETTIEGVMRENQGHAPWYLPQNDRKKNIWFWIDLPEMITMLKDTTELQNIKQVLIQQTNLTTKNNFMYPIPVDANITFYNQHLTYVITWFTLSAVIVIMLLLYLRKSRKKLGE